MNNNQSISDNDSRNDNDSDNIYNDFIYNDTNTYLSSTDSEKYLRNSFNLKYKNCDNDVKIFESLAIIENINDNGNNNNNTINNVKQKDPKKFGVNSTLHQNIAKNRLFEFNLGEKSLSTNSLTNKITKIKSVNNNEDMKNKKNNDNMSKNTDSSTSQKSPKNREFDGQSDFLGSKSRPLSALSRPSTGKKNYSNLFSNDNNEYYYNKYDDGNTIKLNDNNNSNRDNSNKKKDINDKFKNKQNNKTLNKFGVVNDFESPDNLPKNRDIRSNAEFGLSGFGYNNINDDNNNNNNNINNNNDNNSSKKNTINRNENLNYDNLGGQINNLMSDNKINSKINNNAKVLQRPKSAINLRKENISSQNKTSTNEEHQNGKLKNRSLSEYLLISDFFIERNLTSSDSKLSISLNKNNFDNTTGQENKNGFTENSNMTINHEKGSNFVAEKSECKLGNKKKKDILFNNYEKNFISEDKKKEKREKMFLSREAKINENEILREKTFLENDFKSLQNSRNSRM